MALVKVAAIWCRVSTEGQRELSLDSQEVAVRKVLEGQGYDCPPQFVLKVPWTSLDLMSCPPFQQLRRWIADGTVQAVGTLDRDRLQAQGLQRLLFLSECKERAVKIITVQGVPMLEGGEGQLVELALALGKERSVLRAQQGARDGLRDRARLKGLPPSPSGFFGFTWDKEKRKYLPDEHYQAAAEVWRLGLAGGSVRAIATELTTRGIPTPGGSAGWWPYSVRHILKNPAYSGVVEALRTEVVEPKRRRANTYGKSGRRFRPESERVRLDGLVERPIVIPEEFAWMQQRLLENRERATRNTKVRTYLLRGLVRCAACGRAYTGVTIKRRGKAYSYYACGAKWNPGPHKERCGSRWLSGNALETAVFTRVVDFLRGPEGFQAELRRRHGVSEETEASIRRELEDLDRQERRERDAEAEAFRLRTRGKVSDAVYEQEVGLIHTKQRWISEQRERLTVQLADLERYQFNPEAVSLLRERLEARLAGASVEDRRFVLEALDAKALVQADGLWELELQVPRDVPAPEGERCQIADSRPGSNSAPNTGRT